MSGNSTNPAPEKAPGTSRLVIPHRLPWHKRLIGTLIYIIIRLMAATIRWRFVDRSGLFDPAQPPRPVIFSIWHNRLALCLMTYRNHPQKRQPARRMAAIVSASKDGAIVAHVLECFKVQPVRGSSSRRGAQALLELTTWAERGYDIAFTPDGPRGPRYQVHDGPIALAQLTGLPIVPVSYWLKWKYCLKSWDRFQIPLPFSLCEVTLGEPVEVPKEASETEHNEKRQLLNERMNAITRD